MAQAQQPLPEHMKNTPSAIVQVIAGLIFATFLAAMTWGLVIYLLDRDTRFQFARSRSAA